MEQPRAARDPKYRDAPARRHDGPFLCWSAASALLFALSACGAETPAVAGQAGGPSPFAGAAAPSTAGRSGAIPVAGSAAAVGFPTAGTPGLVAAAGGGAVVTPTAASNVLPCAVTQVLATNCQTCHGTIPIGGAPMAMMTYADFHKPSPTQPAMQVHQVAKLRLHDTMRPMPPTTVMPPNDMTTLDTWLGAGALAGNPEVDSACALTPPPVGGPGAGDGSTGKLAPGPGETCYEFKTHQSTTAVDDVPYNVGPDGEHYEQFYFSVPWAKDTVATSYATVSDNAKVLHHWLLFSTNEKQVEGYHKTVPLPTLIGANPVLLAGWAVGGPNLVAPKDVGFELPQPGQQLNVQWHFYNSTGSPQSDASFVQICTVPKAMRAHVGSVTWMGTEDLGGNKWAFGPGMPAKKESTFTTSCIPGRKGLAAGESIHIIGFEPHMHRIGKHMTTSVKHTNGMMETIFDKPFSFGNETHYFADYELKAGDTLTTSCTFNNTNDYGVPFGESSDTEMCYQFTFHWPAHSLSNGASSLLGVTDTCW